MRLFAYVFVLACAFCPGFIGATETANARIWCLSLRFQQGTDSFGDTLDLSTIGSPPNGELAPYNGLTYISGFSLDDFNFSGIAITGTIYINLPPVLDANSNGFDDFFESALGITATSSGSYTTSLGNGTVTANWSRGVGSKDGSCGLHLVDNTYGDLGYFTHYFELIEYTGPLLYSPGSNVVSGSVNLVKTGDSTSQLQGPVQFVKVSTDRFNRLTMQPGGWTNSAAQVLTYTNNLFLRDLPWTTNYYGLVQFSDGDATTATPDYRFWMLSIDDTNDANHNGIPDFSDDPQTIAPPNAPRLGLTWSSTNVLISISGDIGHVHDIQQSFLLPATNWQTVASITLTNSPVAVPITLAPGQTAFWRVVAH